MKSDKSAEEDKLAKSIDYLAEDEGGQGGLVCGDDEEEEGKMPAVNNNSTEDKKQPAKTDDRKQPAKSDDDAKKPAAQDMMEKKMASEEGKLVAGDAVDTAPVIDVDDMLDTGTRPQPQRTDSEIKGEIAGYRQETGLSGEEQDFADHISEISHDDMTHMDDLEDGRPPMSGRNGKQDVPLSRFPDMDDTAGPKDHLMSQPPARGVRGGGATTSRRLRAPPPPSMAASTTTGALSTAPVAPPPAAAPAPAQAPAPRLNSQVSDWMSTIPEPTPLRASTANARCQITPGAYSVTPPNRMRIGRSANTDGDEDTTTDGTVEISSGRNNSNSTNAQAQVARERYTPPPPQPQDIDMLVQATLVEDGDAVDPTMLASMDLSSDSRSGSSGSGGNGGGGGRHGGSGGRRDRETPTNREAPAALHDNIALVEAKPLDDSEWTWRDAIRSRWTQLNIFLVISLITIAIVLGVLAIEGGDSNATDNNNDDNINNSNNGGLQQSLVTPIPTASSQVPSPAPTIQVGQPVALSEPPSIEPTGAPSEIPTWAPTYGIIFPEGTEPTDSPKVEVPTGPVVDVPTVQPSNAPTDAPLTRDDLLPLLPEYTIEAMRRTGSPQFKAFEWLWGDPNIQDYSLERMIQRFALMTVLNSLGADDSAIRANGNNMYKVHECDWNSLGLRCDKNQVLSGIHLARAGLQGTLPLQLGLLTSLRKIDVSQNDLTETIPTTLGDIEGIQVINLALNSLTGSLPYSIAYMKQLRELIVNDNGLMSTLPAELGWLTHLRQLRMAYNSFTGSIPGTLRHLTSLETLILNNNQLSGALPDALGDLVVSREMELQGNQLTGTIPTSLGRLSELLVLDLSENELTGTVPFALGNLYSVTRIELQMNSLRGTLPLDVCVLKEFFDLTDIMVDCNELECICFCICYTDVPAAVDKSQP